MSDVVSIFPKMREKNAEKKEETNEETDVLTVEEVAAKNKANNERLKKERANANKSVLRSYRIKN